MGNELTGLNLNKGKNILIELHFAPSLFYFWVLWNSNRFEIETKENYNKRSFRNKCIIKSNVGSQIISIPLVKGKNSHTSIQSVEIAYYDNWIRILLHTLQTEFGKYPFFEYYIDDIKNIISGKYSFLFDLNKELLTYLCDTIGTPPPDWSVNYKKVPSSSTVDFRDTITPKLFNHNKILHTYALVDYFEINPGHSILEALFKYGPETGSLLHKMEIP